MTMLLITISSLLLMALSLTFYTEQKRLHKAMRDIENLKAQVNALDNELSDLRLKIIRGEPIQPNTMAMHHALYARIINSHSKDNQS